MVCTVLLFQQNPHNKHAKQRSLRSLDFGTTCLSRLHGRYASGDPMRYLTLLTLLLSATIANAATIEQTISNLHPEYHHGCQERGAVLTSPDANYAIDVMSLECAKESSDIFPGNINFHGEETYARWSKYWDAWPRPENCKLKKIDSSEFETINKNTKPSIEAKYPVGGMASLVSSQFQSFNVKFTHVVYQVACDNEMPYFHEVISVEEADDLRMGAIIYFATKWLYGSDISLLKVKYFN
jgi:deoxyribodipyrimidine photolyase